MKAPTVLSFAAATSDRAQNRMRISAISNSRVPSATANSIQAMKMCDALAEAGHDVRLEIPAETAAAPWEELAKRYGLRHEFAIGWLPSRRALRRLDFVAYAHAAASKHRADLIYTWLPQSAVIESLLGRPVILEMHADVAGRMGAWWLRQFWKGGRRRRLLVTTQALRSALERSTSLAFPEDSVQIAPNGVDLDRYHNLPGPTQARAQLRLPEGPTVGFTGHFYRGRGMDLLFELASALPKTYFLWVGGTPDAIEAWRGRLSESHRGNVTLTGFVDNQDLPLYQAAADILVMPYGNEIAASSGQNIAEVINPMKMFEYMAAERAIVTADLPVIREVLDETRAVFCPPGDVAAWKAAIESLMSDDDRRHGLAGNARREVEKYTWSARARRAVTGFGR